MICLATHVSIQSLRGNLASSTPRAHVAARASGGTGSVEINLVEAATQILPRRRIVPLEPSARVLAGISDVAVHVRSHSAPLHHTILKRVHTGARMGGERTDPSR